MCKRTRLLTSFGLAICVALSLDSIGVAADPINNPQLVLVVDKSGSTKGAVQQRMLESIASLLTATSNTDVGVVAFDTTAQVIVPMMALTDESRGQIITKIKQIQAQGGTDVLKGLEAALQLMGKKAGTVVLVSDGLHSGAGVEPLPESVWGRRARLLTQQARFNQITVHAVGLGPDVAADPMLRSLAKETGGAFYGVRKSPDLLSQFVSLASQLGSYWRRSDRAEFDVPFETSVVQVVESSSAPHQLFRLDNGRKIPLDPKYRIVHGRVRAERFRLARGRYLFQPSAAGGCDLLRPMGLSFALTSPDLPAGRSTPLAVAVTPHRAASRQLDLRGVQMNVLLRYGDQGRDETVSLVHQAQAKTGLFSNFVRTPTTLSRYTAIVQVEQHGWHYRRGELQGRLVVPQPLNVIAKSGLIKEPVRLQTSGSTASTQVQVTFNVMSHDHDVTVHVASANPNIRVEPARLKMREGRQTVPIALRWAPTHDIPMPREIDSVLRFTVESSDQVSAVINGSPKWDLAIHWLHLDPRLVLSGIATKRDFSTRRDSHIDVPITLTGNDLPKGAGVRIDASGFPPGFHAGFVDEEGQPISLLHPDTSSASIRIAVDKEVMPREYMLQLVIGSSDPSVRLNGHLHPLRIRLDVSVEPVEAMLSFASSKAIWDVVAPCEKRTRPVALQLQSFDGGPLPAVALEDFRVDLVEGAHCRVLGHESKSPDVIQVDYELSVPAQAAPFSGRFQVRYVGEEIHVPASPSLAVAVHPIELHVHVEDVAVPGYQGSLERWLGWLHGPTRHAPKVSFEGEFWQSCDPSWKVLEDGKPVVSDPSGRNEFWQDRSYRVLASTAYNHTEFIPSSEVPLNVRRSSISLPPWFLATAFVAVLTTLMLGGWCLRHLLAWLDRRFIVRVKTNEGRVSWRIGSLSLGRLLGFPELGLKLSGGKLYRRAKQTAIPAKVIVNSSELGRMQLPPGDVLSVVGGDIVEVIGSNGRQSLEILARRHNASSPDRGASGRSASRLDRPHRDLPRPSRPAS